jgi:recombination protein RecT
MSTEIVTTKSFFERQDVKAKFTDLFKNEKKATAFMTSVLQIAMSNEMLKKAEPSSIYQSAMVAATLNLPLNNNLGFAYIVPFNDRKSGKQLAQFQLGYKGFIQLAQRSGQFKSIYAAPVFEGQILEENPLDGYVFDFTKKSTVLIGYAAKFKLLNGYEATLYMTVDELKKHGTKYSQTFKKGFGLWNDNFEAMASKTVLKLLLSKFAPLSVEMEKAVLSDQAIVIDAESNEFEYLDNTKETSEDASKEIERKRILEFIENSTDAKALNDALVSSYNNMDVDLQDAFDNKILSLTNNK